MDYHASCMALGQEIQCKLITLLTKTILSPYVLEWIIILHA